MAAEARVLRDMAKLSKIGNALRFPATDSLGDGLFELRTSHNKNIYRNLFVYHRGDIIILVSFQKKTQTTPQDRIRLARDRKAELEAGGYHLGSITRH